MSQSVVFKGVYPIGDTDTNALPVKQVGPGSAHVAPPASAVTIETCLIVLGIVRLDT